MDVAAIASLPPMVEGGTAAGRPQLEVAREFEGMLWEMLIKESRLFELDAAGEGGVGMGPMGSVLDQVLATQLAQGLELGIGRTMLGSIGQEVQG